MEACGLLSFCNWEWDPNQEAENQVDGEQTAQDFPHANSFCVLYKFVLVLFLPAGLSPLRPVRGTWCWPSRLSRPAQTGTSEPGGHPKPLQMITRHHGSCCRHWIKQIVVAVQHLFDVTRAFMQDNVSKLYVMFQHVRILPSSFDIHYPQTWHLPKVITTFNQTSSWVKNMDFSGSEHCWNIWNTVGTQLNIIFNNGLVVWRYCSAEMLHRISSGKRFLHTLEAL